MIKIERRTKRILCNGCPTVLFSAFLEGEEKTSVIGLTFGNGRAGHAAAGSLASVWAGKRTGDFLLVCSAAFKDVLCLQLAQVQDVGGVNRLHKALSAVICSASSKKKLMMFPLFCNHQWLEILMIALRLPVWTWGTGKPQGCLHPLSNQTSTFLPSQTVGIALKPCLAQTDPSLL